MAKITAARINSPLVSALNNVVSINRSKSTIASTQQSYNQFLRFMSVEVRNVKAIKLPEKSKLRSIGNLNVASTFGSAGSLLSSLVSGALDAAGFVGNLFGNKKDTPQKGGKPIPKSKGVRLGGVKALGVANAAFAGLDFATGLAQGESVGKAAAGAGGALAGSLLGGAIGQTLIPVPGLGYVIGSMAGNFLGGYLADRGYEAATGAKEGKAKDKISTRLKQQEQKQKSDAALSQTTLPQVLDKFDSVVSKFAAAASAGYLGSSSSSSGKEGASDVTHGEIQPRKDGGDPPPNPQDVDYTATGGSLPSKHINTYDYNEFRQYYNGGRGGRHPGEDLPVNQGTKVSIIVPGKVARAHFGGDSAGGDIVITHEDGKQTRYVHMSEIYVKPGDIVQAGQVIGATGGTPGTKGAGNSLGPHLHFEYYNDTQSGPGDPHPHMDRYFRFGGNVKVKPKPGAGTGTSGAGKPTAVLMAGTNDYGSPQSGAAGVKQAIKELQDKGYNVVVVPPSEVGGTAKVSQAVQQAAKEMGATVRKAEYKPKDNSGAIGYAHLTDQSAKDIKNENPGATFIGDSNAQMISGAKIAMPGKSASEIAAAIRTQIPTAGPPARQQMVSQVAPARTQVAPAQTQAVSTQQLQQMQQYPTYNSPQSSVVLVPMLMGGGNQSGSSQQRPMVVSNGQGGQTTVMPSGPSQSQLLNSFLNTMLFTNLSGT